MKWLKHVWLDLIVTAFIGIVAFQNLAWGMTVLWIYSGIMLALKVVALTMQGVLNLAKRAEQAVPAGFLHVLYAVNVAILVGAAWWGLAVLWLIIWGLSFWADTGTRRVRSTTKFGIADRAIASKSAK